MELSRAWAHVIRESLPRPTRGLPDVPSDALPGVAFLASDFCDWVVGSGACPRSRAVALGEMLRARGIIAPLSECSGFGDAGSAVWAACAGGGAPPAFSVAALLSAPRSYVMGAAFLKQGALFLNPRYLVLDTAARLGNDGAGAASSPSRKCSPVVQSVCRHLP